MTEESAIELMEERGFYYTFESKNFSGGDKHLHFTFDNRDNYKYNNSFSIPAFAAEVSLKDERFRFTWKIPGSINDLTTPWCSPVSSEDQFWRICHPYVQHACILNKYFATSI